MCHRVCKYTICKENSTHTCIPSRTPPAKDGSTLQPEFSTKRTGAGWDLILGNLRPGEGGGAGQAIQPVVSVQRGHWRLLPSPPPGGSTSQEVPGPVPPNPKRSYTMSTGHGSRDEVRLGAYYCGLGGPWALSLPKAQAVGGLIFKTHSVTCAADGNQSKAQCGPPGPGLPPSCTPHAFQHLMPLVEWVFNSTHTHCRQSQRHCLIPSPAPFLFTAC